MEKKKTKKMEKNQKEGEGMEWVSSILAIPAPFPTPYKHGRSEGFTAG